MPSYSSIQKPSTSYSLVYALGIPILMENLEMLFSEDFKVILSEEQYPTQYTKIEKPV